MAHRSWVLEVADGEVRITGSKSRLLQMLVSGGGVNAVLAQGLGWRRGWDSNPRYACTHNGFRDRPNRPLWHLSTGWLKPKRFQALAVWSTAARTIHSGRGLDKAFRDGRGILRRSRVGRGKTPLLPPPRKAAAPDHSESDFKSLGPPIIGRKRRRMAVLPHRRAAVAFEEPGWRDVGKEGIGGGAILQPDAACRTPPLGAERRRRRRTRHKTRRGGDTTLPFVPAVRVSVAWGPTASAARRTRSHRQTPASTLVGRAVSVRSAAEAT